MYIYIYCTVGCSCSHTSFHLSPKEQDTVPVKKHRKDSSLIFRSQSPGKLKIHLGEATPINQHFSQSRSGSNCDKLLLSICSLANRTCQVITMSTIISVVVDKSRYPVRTVTELFLVRCLRYQLLRDFVHQQPLNFCTVFNV